MANAATGGAAHNYFADQHDHSQDESEQERVFDMIVRVNLIYFGILFVLYILAYAIISIFSKKRDDVIPAASATSKRVAKRRLDEDEDVLVYRISTWLCTFTLAISIGAASLLPFSILTNEVLGDSQHHNDTNTYATTITTNTNSIEPSPASSIAYQYPSYTSSLTWSLLNGLWRSVFLFSNISLFLLLPFAYFFTESEGFSGSKRGIRARLRETFVLLFLVSALVLGIIYIASCLFFNIGCLLTGLPIFSIWQYLPFLYSCISFIGVLLLLLCTPRGISHLFTVFNQIDTIQSRNLNYALAMIILLMLTGSSMLLVLQNTVELLVGFKALPATIGQIKSLSKMGVVGATLEIVLVLYLWCASLVGLYNLPGFCHLRPRKQNTSFNQIIGNCAVLCLLSSALPLIARTLGITNFDLLADFGRVEWLGNLYVVLSYNLVFLVTTALCLTNKLSKPLLFGLQIYTYYFNRFTKRKHPSSPSKSSPLGNNSNTSNSNKRNLTRSSPSPQPAHQPSPSGRESQNCDSTSRHQVQQRKNSSPRKTTSPLPTSATGHQQTNKMAQNTITHNNSIIQPSKSDKVHCKND